jgi:D-galactosaminyltransferase
VTVAGARIRPRRPEPGHPASHNNRVGLWWGTLIALFLLIAPGAIIARITQLTWPIAIAVGPALTYGVVALAIIPFGAIGIPWNGWTALATLVVVCVVMIGLQPVLARYRDTEAEARGIARRQALTVAAGVLLGALLIMWAAYRGVVHWQSIPSTWDAVWHANTVRFILDTGQASSTHMGELRNVETHQPLYYPSVFHALTAVYCQLTGAAPTTGYTLSSVAAAVWLFPSSAAMLTWQLLRPRTPHAAGVAATAAALSASFTSVPYVEFGTAAMPNLAAYGIAIPTFVLVISTLRHRDRIPVAVLALVGVFSVHLSGGFVVILFAGAWWLLEACWHPVRGRMADVLTLAAAGVPAGLILAPQFIGVAQQAGIIAGHAFPSFKTVKQGVIDALLLHTRHLNDFPTQYGLVALAGIGMAILLYKRIWWPPVLWLVLTVATIYSGAPFRNPLGAAIEQFSQFFYNDPRRLSAVVTMLVTPMAAVAVFALVVGAVAVAKRFIKLPAPVWVSATVLLLALTTVFSARQYLYRHLVLFGDKYDSVIINQKDLDAFAHLAALPGARTTLIGDSNVDGTAWMYAVADLHPLWTHYDFPQQIGPGYYRFIFWAYADADALPGVPEEKRALVPEAIRALNIRYILTSAPTVRGFKVPDGLVSIDQSKWWAKIYDNGEAWIYEWRGAPTTHQMTGARPRGDEH